MSKRKAKGQTIQGESQEPTYYARIPKMATMSLNPYELALYCHYKQVAAEHGVCFKANKTIAQDAQMSINKMKTVRAALEKKGFILVERAENDVHENQPVRVTIRDVWALNHQLYAEQKVFEQESYAPNVTPLPEGGVSPRDRGVSQDDRGISPRDTKEELIKNNQDKKVSTDAARERTELTDLDADLDGIPDHISPAIMRQLGFNQKLTSKAEGIRRAKAVEQLQANPIWQAFAKGWDGIEPTLYPTMAHVYLRACNVLQARMENNKEFTLDDIEGCTREQLKKPRTGNYLIEYVPTDISDYMLRKRKRAGAVGVVDETAVPDEWGADTFVRRTA